MSQAVVEPQRTLPVFGDYDVVVVGGGPAGIAAAVTASRHGARTLLVERYGFLGGMGTAGGVTNFAGLYGKREGEMTLLVRGVADELLARIDALGGLNKPQDGLQGRIRVRSYDTSIYKCAADQLLLAAGVHLLFHALAAAVVMDGDRVAALVVETKSGRQAIRANAFIDASGDADVAAFAGVPFVVGDGQGSGLFPSTMFRVGHVEAERALAAVGEFKAINDLMQQARERDPAAYSFPREGAILRPQIDPREWRANVTQIRNAEGGAMNGVDARQLSDGEVEGRRQIGEFFRFLKAEVPGFERSAIVEIAPQVGIRETRRIEGLYALTGEDILSSARFGDSIGINAWPMEMHAAGRIEWAFPRDEHRTYNQLPWRMLVPRGVANLLVAGRCASMTHEGQSAARASGGCFVMGQAAGTAAAALGAGDFAAVDVPALQRRLAADGVDLDT
ncbi:FAD-dependent oxidoreductase [Variovorax saccharolyticus]|uniref:FAD-dependent oxidoreductase n=1 Tax=Variovorax saccharolyticus TaxID=3053516 RepID=UPI0025789E36|nr:FAD-dependent oxidoreductase [Variovorax sp. J31P216]MDM0027534.1 FAD-dependent oxidoreductase [Variovorax sp. J31P216]